MDISRLTLKSFRKIVMNLIKVIEARNSHPKTAHLRVTASWLFHEKDEDVFELLKWGAGGDYMREILAMEVPSGRNTKGTKKRKEENKQAQGTL